MVFQTAQPIRKMRDSDFASLADLRRDRPLQDLLMGYPKDGSVSDDDVHAWLTRRIEDPSGCFFVISDNAGGCAGFVQLTQIHRMGGRAYFGVAMNSAARGEGLGSRAVAGIIAYGQSEFGCTKILAEVRADNEPSHRMCTALGFKPVGTLRRHYKNFDVTLFELLL